MLKPGEQVLAVCGSMYLTAVTDRAVYIKMKDGIHEIIYPCIREAKGMAYHIRTYQEYNLEKIEYLTLLTVGVRNYYTIDGLKGKDPNFAKVVQIIDEKCGAYGPLRD
ncbi:MAG: hypothetical protein E7466_04240 [Ruminococcaceae bacterium]|nr:hypothetical protein [Oscillospiraceae bacterium]